ncbi:hypothetical protein LTR99_001633 [Exophiala xenobiotica]|uniref:C2H2-type domain-containing protein n=1 Tax=Vermiconidia calcicola TaxID=1690605 RepID=A0AAV9QJ86_9PEZI|nr:hypothetical protein LTR92_008969 [Exophiala xenobiotica]KAK5544142.1 hypothetical protein LTR25_001757 [Vermiconidia calcicola]KAK5547577.1 hypothetical protein LTR23_002330 [Chaetothyriales sp. CCFEE 6169]KAK5229421.1 hypothetical protein LTR72_000952 [Exophiala xenobiotica]KAK5271209.1 hypothetical protein LTR96_003033 [Exophiala xenobiotica]
MPYTLPTEPGAPYVGGSNDDSAGSSPDGAMDTSHTLEEAIETATPSRLRTVLLQVCQDNHLARDLATKALLVSTITPVEGTGGSNLKDSRKRKRFEVCGQCDDEYEVERNELGLCVYHPGQKEVDLDSSVWDDYNWDVAGGMSDYEDDPECQDGFLWNCCDEKLGSVGCQTTRHCAGNSGEKKRRN